MVAILVDPDRGLSRCRGILVSIPGIGAVTAMAILIEIPARVALRFNPELKQKCQCLISGFDAAALRRNGRKHYEPDLPRARHAPAAPSDLHNSNPLPPSRACKHALPGSGQGNAQQWPERASVARAVGPRVGA